MIGDIEHALVLVGIKDSENADGTMFLRLFADAVRIAEERNVPLYCGEYGVIDRAEDADAAAWYQAISAAFERFGIGRAAWTYRCMDFGVTDACREKIADQIIKLL